MGIAGRDVDQGSIAHVAMMQTMVAVFLAAWLQCSGASPAENYACATALAGDSAAHAYLARQQAIQETQVAQAATRDAIAYLTSIAPTATPQPTSTPLPTATQPATVTPQPSATADATVTATPLPTPQPVAQPVAAAPWGLIAGVALLAIGIVLAWPWLGRYLK